MRVFVGGASGAIGVPIVKALLTEGHEVTGSTRSAERAKTLETLGAKVALVDAFDAHAVEACLQEAEPEVVIDALTALPKDGPRKAADLNLTNRVRREATRNLLVAAIAVGAKRYVAESFFLVYGTGDLGPAPLREDQPVPVQKPNPYGAEIIDAALTKERMVLEASKHGAIEGVVTRFAGFYGPGAGIENMLALLRKRSVPVPRSCGATPGSTSTTRPPVWWRPPSGADQGRSTTSLRTSRWVSTISCARRAGRRRSRTDGAAWIRVPVRGAPLEGLAH